MQNYSKVFGQNAAHLTETEKMLLSNRIMVDELVAAVREGQAITRACTGHDARWSLEMIMAIHASHLQDRKVALPLADRHNPYAHPSA